MSLSLTCEINGHLGEPVHDLLRAADRGRSMLRTRFVGDNYNMSVTVLAKKPTSTTFVNNNTQCDNGSGVNFNGLRV